jgi:hypothetical protein
MISQKRLRCAGCTKTCSLVMASDVRENMLNNVRSNTRNTGSAVIKTASVTTPQIC